MDIQYVYTKKRNQLGLPTNFSDRSADILVEISPNLSLLQDFIYRDPAEIGVQNSIQLSEHTVPYSFIFEIISLLTVNLYLYFMDKHYSLQYKFQRNKSC